MFTCEKFINLGSHRESNKYKFLIKMEDKEQQPNKKPLTREQVLLLKTMKARKEAEAETNNKSSLTRSQMSILRVMKSREEENLKPKMNWEVDQLTKNQRAMLKHQMNKKKLEEKKDEDDKN